MANVTLDYRSLNLTAAELHYGWVSSPNTRGTIDIIWACTTTIFANVWVMLHLNLPAATDSDAIIYLRKLKWFMMAILAPELLMLFAGGQWAAAKRSVEDMKTLNKSEWTMIHAFYAESGGFILQPKQSEGFPITARQIYYLVQRGYIRLPPITTEEIFDRSKADHFAKVVAGVQSGWFALQVIARGIQRLAVSLLELSTICLMTCTAAALFFWFHKPLDVRTPVTISCEATISEILNNAGEAVKAMQRNTPMDNWLDFCEDIEYTSTQFPLNSLWGEKKRPLPRIPNDRDSLLHNWKVVLVISIPTAAFGTLQLIAWNFAFPSRVEKMLWRWTCVGGGSVLAAGCVLEAGAIVASNYKLSGMRTFNDYKTKWPHCLIFYVAGLLYFLARIIVITETIISLRALPTSCFDAVQWTNMLPHV